MSSDGESLPPNAYERKAASIISAVTVLGLSAIVAVALRFKCRSMASAKLATNDWLILVALLTGRRRGSILVGYSIKGGSGRHVLVVLDDALLLGGKVRDKPIVLLVTDPLLTASGIVKLWLRLLTATKAHG
ncbi:hypothetical protein F4808DRAFT_460141 [Astrocystis sublimbata]|nr:hypothetical protein F4808DRAFT_460141 [Astrocystis sublimbata]